MQGIEIGDTAGDFSATGSSGNEVDQDPGPILDQELVREIDDMAYPAEVRMKLFNMYPENYKDRVEQLEKVLQIEPELQKRLPLEDDEKVRRRRRRRWF